MATSNSIDYSLTARQVIEYALRLTNILANGNTPSSEVADDALITLNVMLKEWMPHASIWRLKEGYVTPVANQQGYSLTPRPYCVVDVRYRLTSANDLPMSELTRQEYYDIPTKTANGTPTSWYYDPQRSTSNLYIWPLPSSVSTETLRVTYQRRFEDVDDLGNDIDVDQQHLSLVAYNVASRLADRYGKSGPHVERIHAHAADTLEKLLDADRPEVIRFVPETRYG